MNIAELRVGHSTDVWKMLWWDLLPIRMNIDINFGYKPFVFSVLLKCDFTYPL